MIQEARSIIRFRTAASITGRVLLFYLTVWSWSVPVSMQAGTLSWAPEPSSVTGKVAVVGASKFTLDFGRNQNPNKLEFLIDSDTKIEGTIVVGVQANVDYRADGDRLIATHVVVMPPSGIRAD